MRGRNQALELSSAVSQAAHWREPRQAGEKPGLRTWTRCSNKHCRYRQALCQVSASTCLPKMLFPFLFFFFPASHILGEIFCWSSIHHPYLHFTHCRKQVIQTMSSKVAVQKDIKVSYLLGEEGTKDGIAHHGTEVHGCYRYQYKKLFFGKPPGWLSCTVCWATSLNANRLQLQACSWGMWFQNLDEALWR